VVRTVASVGRSVARAAELRTARRLDGFLQGEGGWHLISGGSAGEGGLEITKLAFLSQVCSRTVGSVGFLVNPVAPCGRGG
jgi:hypothetical protein